MPLAASLQIGRSALTASQVAIQVTGNNFANAATPGYSRQVVGLAPTRETRLGAALLGRGVEVQGIRRQVDSALLSRLHNGLSNEAAAATDRELLSQVESTLNELSENDLSSELSRFFNSWSELANSPGSTGARSLVVQQGSTLAGFVRNLRQDLGNIRTQIDQQLDASVTQANHLLSEIATINTNIVQAEAGSSVANGLRDQRDSLIAELSQYLDVTAVEQPSGVVDVLVGSLPVVLAGDSRGIELVRESTSSGLNAYVQIQNPRQRLNVSSGRVGALLSQRGTLVDDTIARLDQISSQIIFQVNRAHSGGYSAAPLTSTRGTTAIDIADATRAFNDPANVSFRDLPFHPTTGGFLVTVKNTASGSTETVRIDVDLDGINAAGQPGYGDDTSVTDIRDALNTVANLTATVNSDGTLSINAAPGFEFSFAQDTSGVLATLGVNTYFTGTDATNIAVRPELLAQPGLLNAGRVEGGTPNDNGVAGAIAVLQDEPNAALGGSTIRGSWQESAQSIGLRTSAAASRAQSTQLVRESLEAQRAAISGVSVDEESINLLTYQRQYQGAARFISVVDELTQTLINLV
ncbi:MAG: flagellar hook-associated protein FlgK [Phycisphaerales bacterium]